MSEMIRKMSYAYAAVICYVLQPDVYKSILVEKFQRAVKYICFCVLHDRIYKTVGY